MYEISKIKTWRYALFTVLFAGMVMAVSLLASFALWFFATMRHGYSSYPYRGAASYINLDFFVFIFLGAALLALFALKIVFIWLYNSNLLRFGKLKMRMAYKEQSGEYALKELDSVSVAKVVSLLSVIASCALAIFLILTAIASFAGSDSIKPRDLYVLIVILLFLVGLVFSGFVFGSVLATFYNWLAPHFGYLRFKLRHDQAGGLFEFSEINGRSLGALIGFYNFFISIPGYLFFMLSSSLSFYYYLNYNGGILPFMALIAIPVIIAVVGYLEGLLFAAIYNFFGRKEFGVRAEIKRVSEGE